MLDQFSEVIYFSKGILRNKWVITIVAWLICLAGWSYVYNMPDIYLSKARVHVDTRTMLRPLLKGMAVQTDIRGLVMIMKKLMFTQHNLISVAELAGMDVDLTSESKLQKLIKTLRDNVTISGGKDEIFTITYESEEAQNSKNVVQAVLSVFSKQTQQSTMSDVDSAQRFIDNQIREYEQRLRNAERAKENFKRENIGMLPGQAGEGQISVIQSFRQNLDMTQMQLSELLSRKRVLQNQLTETKESGDEWGLTSVLEESSIEDERISALEEKRSELLLRYTENHPNIISIDYLIQKLQKRKEEDLALKDDDHGLSTINMTNPYVQTIKIALNNLDAEIASLNSRAYLYQKKIQREDDQFNARLAIETELQNLNRDYQTINKNYLSLIDRREKAKMSSNIDTQASALKFNIADPANLPLEPSSPNRKLLYTLVLIVGFIAGIALALLMVIIRPSFMDVKQLKSLTETPVLGSISEVVSKTQSKKNFLRLVRFVFINTLLFCSYLGVLFSDIIIA